MRILMCSVLMFAASNVSADPCGMVPPIYEGRVSPIQRTGVQKTYVFFDENTSQKDLGLETLVIRPSFVGNVDNFGMLIPFPAVPAMRKVPDNIFDHIASAVQPPEIVIDLIPRPSMMADSAMEGAGSGAPVAKSQVRVLKKEAVGMYQIAVLEAGSPKALEKWMSENSFSYPEGMDKAVQAYVDDRWVFVAVKTRVGAKAKVDPRPGMRNANPNTTGGFTGNVQAMGFRFWVKAPVVPMRLSTFNEGELRNVVYVLANEPVRIKGIDKNFVRRQITGEALYKNTHDLLPIRVIGPTPSASQLKRYESMRNPKRHNGIARALFASDLLATQSGLEHDFEMREKSLLNINERLGLRGPQIDSLIKNALTSEQENTIAASTKRFRDMTLTVIDGDFPRDFLRDFNLEFETHTMNASRNNTEQYDARPQAYRGSPYGLELRPQPKK